MASQWKRDNSTTFTIRISNDTGLPDRIHQAAQKSGMSVNQLFIHAVAKEVKCALQPSATKQAPIVQTPPSPQSITIQIILPSSKEER